MGAGVERRVLEVRSNGGRILEGVFEVTERAVADDYVASLAAGCGVRAKVLDVSCAGIATRSVAVERAWNATEFPPGWYVLVQPGVGVVLAVYGSALAAEAGQQQHELSVQLGVDIDVCMHIHPKRPKVGEQFCPGQAAERPYTQEETNEGIALCEAMLAAEVKTSGPEPRAFDQVWKGEGNEGEAGDVQKTVAGIRGLLAGGPNDRVTLLVGSRWFGELVLRQLSEPELPRVLVKLQGDESTETREYCERCGEHDCLVGEGDARSCTQCHARVSP